MVGRLLDWIIHPGRAYAAATAAALAITVAAGVASECVAWRMVWWAIAALLAAPWLLAASRWGCWLIPTIVKQARSPARDLDIKLLIARLGVNGGGSRDGWLCQYVLFSRRLLAHRVEVLECNIEHAAMHYRLTESASYTVPGSRIEKLGVVTVGPIYGRLGVDAENEKPLPEGAWRFVVVGKRGSTEVFRLTLHVQAPSGDRRGDIREVSLLG